jgi:hypothetical protein
MTAATLAFTRGDVLRTQPRPGYWGCAVVLTQTHKTVEFHPRFHVGVTPFVFRHEFELSEIEVEHFTILRSADEVRVGPNEYVPRATRTCIGIYTAKSRGDIPVLGRIDASRVYDAPLTFEVGDGTNGTFPLCGPLRKGIGWEAVIEWRRLHDAEALNREVVEARSQFEVMEAARLAEQRIRRASKRGNA